MKITVQVLTKSLDIEVGEGRQNIKWLAQIVSTRIAYFKLLRSTFEEEKQLVVSMLGPDGSLLDPNATIIDVLEEDDVVRANVTDEVASDQYGNPIVPVWRQEAFVHSGPGLIFAQGYDAWKRNPSRMRTATTPGEGGNDSLVFIGELSDADVFAALELDWSMMDWTWAVAEPSEAYIYRLKDAIKNHYGVVCRLFAFCAGSGRPGERYGLTLTDFRHILFSAGLFKLSAARRTEALYVQSAGELPAEAGASRPATAATTEGPKYALMSRSEFMDAICRIAVGERLPASHTAAENEAHLIRSVTEILSGPLTKYWNSISANMDSVNNQYNRELLQHCEVYLKEIFESYGSVSVAGPVIRIDTFRDIIYGSNVAEERLAYNQILEDVFLRQCRVVMPSVGGYSFSVPSEAHTPRKNDGFGAKSNKSHNSESSTASGGSDEIEELTFSEFREALVKAVKYAFSKSEELSDDEKMQAGFERLVQIVTRHHK